MSALTPRQRVLKAMAFEETDIVPYDIRIDEALVPRLAGYYGDPAFADRIVNHLPFWPIEAARRWEAADRYVDVFGCVWRVGNIPHIEEHPLKEPSLRGYEFPDLTDESYFSGVETFFARYQDRFTLCGDAHGFFDRGWALRGMEEFLTDLILHPRFVEELLETLTELHLQLVDRIASYPFDGFRFGDDWGSQRGVIIGAERWRRFIKPGLKRIFARARERGLVVMVHSDGDISELIPDLIDIGVQILNPLQPEAMNVLEIKRRYGRHLCLNGGVSTQLTLPLGTPEQVQREVLACLRYLGRGGGYVISPAKPLLPDVPLPNAVALIESILGQPPRSGPGTPGPLPDRVPELERVYAAFHP